MIRRATLDDAKAVAEILNEVVGEGGLTAFDKPFSEAEERDFIAALGNRAALLVAESEGRMAGVQSIDRFSHRVESMRHVATMGTWLKACFRGKGIGRRLSGESFLCARSLDYRKVVIQVLLGNRRALRFYRSLGFRDIGVARRHVLLNGEFHDEVYLERLL